LNAAAFGAFEDIMDKTRLRSFLAREVHFIVACNAMRIVSKQLEHAALQVRKGSFTALRIRARNAFFLKAAPRKLARESG
jgi:hypothetical protein